MRLTKEQAAQNRREIVDAAGRLFRGKGFDGVAVADLMEEAGFTHGGFYNHFQSKDALAAEASRAGIARSEGAVGRALDQKTPRDSGAAWAKYVNGYLSIRHRDDPMSGCTIAALAADAARQSKEVQASFAEGLENLIGALATHLAKTLRDGTEAASREEAVRQWSELVGALVLSRAVRNADPALSEEILRASRQQGP
jgi:TetR/AcrR family transcriptional repressor of nem operon